MIDVAKVFEELFDTLPVTEYGEVFHHLGDEDELDKVLQTRQENANKAYPLLWYKIPNKVSYNSQYANGTFEFIIATNTKLDWFNDQRYNHSFREKIYPVLNYVLQAFRSARNVQFNRLRDKVDYEATEYPNYVLSESSSEDVNDYWDVLLLKVNLTINHNCMGQINYK